MPLHNTIQIPSKVQHRHHILSLVASRYLTIKQAAIELDLSISHTKRLWWIFRDTNGNILKLVPQKRIRPTQVLTKAVRRKITTLYQQHPDDSVLHMVDRLKQDGVSISRETVRKVLNGLKKDPKIRRDKTKPSTRFQAKTFGQIIQMDTCQGAWLTGSGYQHLIACLDDCSRFVVSAAIFSTDSTWTNMLVIKQMIKAWGLPQMLYTDNASHFKTIRHDKLPKWIDKKQYPKTRIQEVLSELGIAHVTHHPFNPRAKGKIERFFRFIQSRLLKNNQARNLIELNYWLHVWLKWYNYEHVNGTTKQKPCDRLSPSSFRPVPPNVDLDKLFVIKETRKVRKDNAISFRGKWYFIPEKHHVAGLTVEVHIADDRLSVLYRDKILITFII